MALRSRSPLVRKGASSLLHVRGDSSSYLAAQDSRFNGRRRRSAQNDRVETTHCGQLQSPISLSRHNVLVRRSETQLERIRSLRVGAPTLAYYRSSSYSFLSRPSRLLCRRSDAQPAPSVAAAHAVQAQARSRRSPSFAVKQRQWMDPDAIRRRPRRSRSSRAFPSRYKGGFNKGGVYWRFSSYDPLSDDSPHRTSRSFWPAVNALFASGPAHVAGAPVGFRHFQSYAPLP